MQFMAGRYGPDKFGSFLSILAMVFLFVGVLGVASGVLFALILSGYQLFRFFSRNRQARLAENSFYLRQKSAVQRWVSTRVQRLKSSGEYRYFRCPTCKKELRVPKGKGEIVVTCPHCKTQFEKKS